MKKFAAFIILFLSFNAKLNSQSDCINSGIDSAIYQITFQSTWNATEHSSIPTNAHWSSLVRITHNTPNEFLELGQNATTGIKNIAELGNNMAFANEAQPVINAGNALDFFITPFNPNNATSSMTFTASFCESHPYLTLLSMVAPSPDWFIAVNSLNLREADPNNGVSGWKDDFVMDVYVYDAGTDNGTNYNSPNSSNTPVPISMISGFPINGNKIGTLTVDFQAISLSVPEFNTLNTVRVFPNPALDNITISNANSVEAIEIYSILGSRIKQINSDNEPQIELNLSDLKSGLYLIKLIGFKGESKTQKLLIK